MAMGNLRNAPLFLRPSVVRGLLGDIHTIAEALATKGLAEVPIAPFALSEPVATAEAAPEPPTPEAPTRLSPLPSSAPVERAAPKPALPKPAAAEPAQSPRPVQYRQPTDPVPHVAGQLSSAAVDHPPQAIEERALRPAARRAGAFEHPPEVAKPSIRFMAERLAARRAADAKVDTARLAAAFASRTVEKPISPSVTLVPAPSREECRRCGIPGWKGCAHQLPYEDAPSAQRPLGSSAPGARK
jgi:hypothetical protein